MYRLLSILCLGMVLVTVGCAAGPFGSQDDPVNVVVNNSANASYTFEVSVVPAPANVTTHRDDGLTGTYRIGQGGRTYSPGENYTWTEVDLPKSARLHGQYRLDPGEQEQSAIEQFSSEFAVVVVIYQDENRIVAWTSDHCSGNLVFVEVAMFDHGSSTVFNCESGFP
jgi:hypothetical protein